MRIIENDKIPKGTIALINPVKVERIEIKTEGNKITATITIHKPTGIIIENMGSEK